MNVIEYTEFLIISFNYPFNIGIFLSSFKKIHFSISTISPAKIPFPSSFSRLPLDKAPSFRHVSLSSPYREPTNPSSTNA